MPRLISDSFREVGQAVPGGITDPTVGWNPPVAVRVLETLHAMPPPVPPLGAQTDRWTLLPLRGLERPAMRSAEEQRHAEHRQPGAECRTRSHPIAPKRVADRQNQNGCGGGKCLR